MKIISIKADFVGEDDLVVVFDGVGVAVDAFQCHPGKDFFVTIL